MKIKILNILILSVFFYVPLLYAQDTPNAPVMNIIVPVTKFAEGSAQEKIYLHTDKPFYTVGDTLWFKVYLFNAAYFTASEKSGIAYMEIANEQNQVVKRLMVSMYVGLGWGNIELKEKEYPQGNYYLRAYTNYMRNFDEHYVFEKQFYISKPADNAMLINAKINVNEDAGKQKASIQLNLNKIDGQPVRLSDFQLNIIQGNKTWYKYKAHTLMDGAIDLSFDIPEKADPAKLEVTLQNLKQEDENPVYQIPLVFTRPEKIDLQFMPEGGYLVNGMDTHIAFKALGEDGKSTNVSGSVFNSKQQEVLSFKSAHLGIGSFNLKPQPGEAYSAKLKLPDGNYSKPYALPQAKTSGITLNVVNTGGSDSLNVSISATPDLQLLNAVHYLVAQSRGIACFGALVRLNKPVTLIKISRSVFPSGIARLSLLNAGKQPLNERIVYIDQGDHLRIHISPDKKSYAVRDSVGMDITVTDKDGKPVQGSFSVAVTDDSQIKNDTLKNNSLKSAMLLTSDLKGNIEDPGYYFPKNYNAGVWQQLDNLLLAQGWINYDWTAVFKPLQPQQYLAESSFTVKGKVTNAFNKPVERSGVILLSRKPSFLTDTVTDKAGVFNFNNIYPADTTAYFIQARNKKGKSMNVGIEVQEFTPPVFNVSNLRVVPWYVNIDSARIKTMSTYVAYKKEQEKLMGARLLKEVKITGKNAIKDSKNLNSDGGSDLVLDQQYLDKAGKMSLNDLITKNVKGFHLGYGKDPYGYYIKDMLVHVIIDGLDIDYGLPPQNTPQEKYDHQKYVEHYLNSYSAEDIKSIEVMSSSQYSASYTHSFLGPLAVPAYNAFLEVTTYAGKGPYLTTTPGTYLYKPLAFAGQKQFYVPQYLTKTDNTFIDSRATVYWSPNIITGKNGKAKFSFYSTDKTGTYTLLINGCDMNGNLESTRQTITVK